MFTLETATQRVNTVARGEQTAPEVVALSNGGFTVAWTDRASLGLNSANAVLQTFNADGVAVGPNRIAAEVAAGAESVTDLIALPDGGFALGWVSSGANIAAYGAGTSTAIPVTRRFGADGAAIGGDVPVTGLNSGTAVGYELVATSGGVRGVFLYNNALRSVDFTNAIGLVTTSSHGLGAFSGTVLEATTAPDGVSAIVMVGDGVATGRTLVSTGNIATTLNLASFGSFSDFTSLGNGLHFLSGTGTQPRLVSGDSNVLGDYFSYAAAFPEPGIFRAQAKHVHLGGDLLAEVFISSFTPGASATGYLFTNTGQDVSGVFVRMLDVGTGLAGQPFLVEAAPINSITSVEAALLANGRLAVTWSRNGTLLNDIYVRTVTIDGRSATGTTAPDSLAGGTGADLLLGLSGADTLLASAGADTLDGGFGSDLVRYAGLPAFTLDLARSANNAGGAQGHVLLSIEAVEGSAGADRILGSAAGGETLDGGAGNDLLRTRAGFGELLMGGVGDDTLDAAQGSGATLMGGDGQDHMLGGQQNDLLLGDAGNDTAIGGLGGDVLDGGAGNDVLDGGAGADVLEGGTGNDTLHGRDDSDTLYGGLGADLLTGLAGDDLMLGEEDNDSLYGGAGTDTLIGGRGNDVLSGGLGNDVLDVGDGGSETALGGAGDDDILGGTGTDSLLGEDGDDEIDGGAGDDAIRGGSGDDLLSGGMGNDTIRGESGVDTLDGGGGDDLLVDVEQGGDLFGGDGFDTASFRVQNPTEGILAFLDNPMVQTGPAAQTRFFSVEAVIGTDLNDSVRGDASGNLLEGYAGADSLDGADGADTLIGGRGGDVLSGGSGNDIFRFGTPADGGDVILEFAAGDRIAILRSGFGVPGGIALVLVGEASTAISAAVPRLFLDIAGANAGQFWFDADSSNAAGRILLATVYSDAEGTRPLTTLAASDLLLL